MSTTSEQHRPSEQPSAGPSAAIAAGQSGTPWHYSIPARFDDVAILAQQIGDACHAADIVDDDTADLMHLCVAEALNNIVEHAYREKPGRLIFADLRIDADGCEVTLIDEGRPMPGLTLPDGALEFDETVLDDLPEGGFGWMLIHTQMDKVDYQRRDNCNVLKLLKTITQ